MIESTVADKALVIYHTGCRYYFYSAVSGKCPNEVRGVSVARSKLW